MPFFNFKKFLKKHNIDFFNKSTSLTIVGPRNVGKTTSPLETLMEEVSNDKKIMIARLTEKQLKMQITDFNERFKGKFTIVSNMIYRVHPFEKYDKLTDETTILYKKGECVGYMSDINNYHNYKSVQAKDVKFIFIDEVIQLDVLPLFYEKLMNTLMTFVRFNQTSILMVGNRDTPNNELMVLWEIEPYEKAPRDDLVYNYDTNCYYVDLGEDQFKDLFDQDDHIVKTMSKHHHQTNLYMNHGGFLVRNAMNVLPYNKKIKDTFDPKYMVTFMTRKAAVGTFENDKLVVCINGDAIEKAENQQLLTIPLDADGFLNRDSIFSTQDNIDKILKMLLIEYKKSNLYCDSFELLTFLEKKIKIAGYLDEY